MKKIFNFLIVLFLACSIESAEMFKFSYNDILDLPVYFISPKNINQKTRLVVVMHGRKRNGEEYRDQWDRKG